MSIERIENVTINVLFVAAVPANEVASRQQFFLRRGLELEARLSRREVLFLEHSQAGKRAQNRRFRCRDREEISLLFYAITQREERQSRVPP
jgi:hypothetical protein